MRIEVETIDSTQVKLVIEVPVEDVNNAFNQAYKSLQGQVSLPGFRKGRVPLPILKSRFADVINGEVLRDVIIPAYEDAIYDKNLIPLTQPTFDPPFEQLKVVENQPFIFTATVNVKPTFEIPDYGEIETDKTPVNVPRENVEEHIKKLQLQSATFEPIEEDRPVQETDCVRIDWTCTEDGEINDQNSAIDIDVDLTVDDTDEHLLKGVVGMRIGEEKSIPQNYDNENESHVLSEKEVVFHIVLHAITRKHLPELDDEFAKDLGYETYNQMHGVIWNNLVEEERILHIEKQKTEILDQLIEKTNIIIPDELVDEYVQDGIQNIQKRMATEQITPEEIGVDMETLPEELRKDIIRQTKQNWIFDEIAEYEGIYVSDDELEWELRRAANQQNRDAQRYADLLKASNRLEEFRIRLQHEKIYDFLIQEASTKKSLIITG